VYSHFVLFSVIVHADLILLRIVYACIQLQKEKILYNFFFIIYSQNGQLTPGILQNTKIKSSIRYIIY